MATYFVNSAATGANNGTSWTDAYTSFGSAVTAASTNGDKILIHYTHQEDLASDTTYTFTANVSVITVNKDASDVYTPMSTSGHIGHASSNVTVAIIGTVKLFTAGLTIRMGGGAPDLFTFGSDGSHQEHEDLRLQIDNTSVSTRIEFGNTDTNCFLRFVNPTINFGNASQKITPSGRIELFGGTVSGTVPNDLFVWDQNDPGGTLVTWEGANLSAVSGNLLGDCTTASATVILSRCDLHPSTTWLAAQTHANGSGAEIYLFDCHSGDNHISIGHQSPLGKTEIDTNVLLTGSAAACSWKITTTAEASRDTPYRTPWIDWKNPALSAITPYVEILRDGSTTAYTDAQVWLELSAKTNASTVRPAFYNDRVALNGSAANQAAGAGLGAWEGENASSWSGKCGLGSSITPAEVGALRARLAAATSLTVHLDPVVRT